MRDFYRAGVAIALIALCASVYSAAQDNPPTQPQSEQPQDNAGKGQAGAPGSAPQREPTVTVIDNHEVQGILGREVRSSADERATHLQQPHFFSFGGALATAQWLRRVIEGDFELPSDGGRSQLQA